MDDVLINGASVGAYIYPLSIMRGFTGVPSTVGSDYQLPGYEGLYPAELGVGPRSVTFGGLVAGSYDPEQEDLDPQYHAAYIAKLIALSTLIYNGGRTFTLSWVAAGYTRNAKSRYVSGLNDVDQLLPGVGRVTIECLLLNPYWS